MVNKGKRDMSKMKIWALSIIERVSAIPAPAVFTAVWGCGLGNVWVRVVVAACAVIALNSIGMWSTDKRQQIRRAARGRRKHLRKKR